MVSQILERQQISSEAGHCVSEGERLGLYGVFETTGPMTAFGLANETMIPVSLALRWLASQTGAGYVVRDVATGRYRTWCDLPGDDSVPTS